MGFGYGINIFIEKRIFQRENDKIHRFQRAYIVSLFLNCLLVTILYILFVWKKELNDFYKKNKYVQFVIYSNIGQCLGLLIYLSYGAY
jgi:hypothetical protein